MESASAAHNMNVNEKQGIINKNNNLLRKKQEQLDYLKNKILILFNESQSLDSLKFQGSISSDEFNELAIDCCACQCHSKKCDAETQTFESDFEKQELSYISSTLDWLVGSNGNKTVVELVQDAVSEAQALQNDYVYNEDYQMYYSQSTGYFYDSERNLFYEPYSQTYYKYNDENNSYDVYYSTDVSAAEYTKETLLEKEASDQPQLLQTKKLREKRLKKKPSAPKEKEIEKWYDVENKGLQTIEDNKRDSDTSSLEEGEIDSDSSCETSPCNPEASCVPYSPASESSNEKWPPCIRAIVQESTHQKIGSLILMTCTGGIIGREKDSSIYIPDVSVSREHAKITFDNDTWQYGIVDLGSQNSTYINDSQITVSNNGNCHELNHGDILRLGSCKLLIHIHDGYNTCKDCEPGLVQAQLDATPETIIKTVSYKTKEEKEQERRNNVKQMKKKFGLKDMNFTPDQKPASSKVYQDRSEQRRKEKGSQNPYEKTEQPVSLEISLPASNKGYKMLKSMGWSEGQSLGVNGSGLSEPIPFHYQKGYSGFGSTGTNSSSYLENNSKSLKKWEKLSERYRKAVDCSENPS